MRVTVGDLVTLAGTSRTINSVSIEMDNPTMSASPSASFGLKFYGIGANSGVGALIGSGPAINTTLQSGSQTITWTGLNQAVPDSFIIAVSVEADVTAILGIVAIAFPYNQPPTIGASDNGFDYANAAGLTLPQGTSSKKTDAGPHNLGFRLVAAPPPVIELKSPSLVGDEFKFQFAAQTGLVYRVEFRSDLTGGEWSPLMPGFQAASNTVRVTDQANGSNQRFYRVRRF